MHLCSPVIWQFPQAPVVALPTVFPPAGDFTVLVGLICDYITVN